MNRPWLSLYPPGVPAQIDFSACASLKDLLAHCKQHLTGYKVPRVVEFRSEPLPKSGIGKILRRELRDGPPITAGPLVPGGPG